MITSPKKAKHRKPNLAARALFQYCLQECLKWENNISEILTLWASTETQNFVRPHVSAFLSKYWTYCFDKHTNGKICSWRSSLWKLHCESMPFGKSMRLCLSEGRCVWSSSGEKLVVLGPWRSYEAHSFLSWLLSSLTPFHSPSRSRNAWRWHRTACALTCIAIVTADRLRRRSVD